MKNRDLMLIALTIFITVLVIVFAQLYQVSRSSKIPPDVNEFITPIEINIDSSVINELKNKNN